jgi:O-acetyl-ADP-ribose deacetylase (regulator of RNase III)
MPTVFVRGDLFHHPGLQALAHGCNCAGAMGKGIAAQFRARFPSMFARYKELCAEGRFKPGDVFTWTEPGITIFNLATQRTWRSKAELNAIATATREMLQVAEQAGISKVGLPRIGSGLGGLPWVEVRTLLDAIGGETAIDLVVFEEYEREREEGDR